MNLLAHLCFTDKTPETIVGSLLGDLVKGRPDPRFSQTVVDAIKLHRAIDTYTDQHPEIRRSKRLVSTLRRRYAGIIVDIFYDHCLCLHWQQYNEQPLENFIRDVYDGIRGYAGYLPQRVDTIFQRMVQANWLACYQTEAGIALTLKRVADRVARENPLSHAIEEWECHRQGFDRHFLTFFPQLVAHFTAPALQTSS